MIQAQANSHHMFKHHYNANAYPGNALQGDMILTTNSLNHPSPLIVPPTAIVMHHAIPTAATTTTAMGHQAHDKRFVWHDPLCSCDNIPNYAFVCLCPCTILSEIMHKLVGLNVAAASGGLSRNSRNHTSDNRGITLSQICCSYFSYALFPGAASVLSPWPTSIAASADANQHEALRLSSLRKTAMRMEEEDNGSDFFQDEDIATCCSCLQEPTQHHASDDTASTGSKTKTPYSGSLLDYIFKFESSSPIHMFSKVPSEPENHDDNHHDYTNGQRAATCSCYSLAALFMASLCFIPATFTVRQITSEKYRDKDLQIKESYWTSGLVSCFAWPCGLVQVLDEINQQELEG